MTYDEFKAHLTTFLWKDSDAQLAASLDNLIRMGNSTLNRKLRTLYTDKTDTLAAVSGNLYSLPNDYYTLTAVTCTDTGQAYTGDFQYMPYQDLMDLWVQPQQQPLKFYSINNKQLVIAGPTDTTINLVLTYKLKVPLTDGVDNWWFDEYLDAYTYAVLIHTAPFLREDERIQLWQSLYNQAILDIEENYYFNQSMGRPKSLPLGSQAGVFRRGDRSVAGYKGQ